MITNEERLLHALYGIKKVLNDFGLEDIKKELNKALSIGLNSMKGK